MYRKFVENRLYKRENVYCCSRCEKTFATEKAALDHCDPKNVFHNRLIQAQFSEPEEEFKSLSEIKLRQLVENGILQDRAAVYQCVICNCVMQRLFNVFAHIRGIRHSHNIKCDEKDIHRTRFSRNVEPKSNSVIEGTSDSKQFCQICGIYLHSCTRANFEEHVRGRKHRKKQADKVSSSSYLSQLSSEQLKSGTQSPAGELCNVKADCKKTSFKHLQDRRHSQNLKEINSKKTFICSACDSVFLGEITLTQHFAHPTNGCKVSSFLKISEVDNRIYNCTICCVEIPCSLDNLNNLIQHTLGKKHKTSMGILKGELNPKIIYRDPDQSKLRKRNLNELLSSFKSMDIYPKKKNKEEARKPKANEDEDPKHDSVSAPKTIVDELCIERIRKTKGPIMEPKKKDEAKLHFDSEYSRIFIEVGPSSIFNISKKKMQKLKSGVELLFLLNDERLCLVCYQRIPNNLQLLYEHMLNIDHVCKLDKLIENDLAFEKHCDQFSDLSLIREFMKEVDKDVISCFACSKEISNDDDVIRKHIKTDENHIMISKKQKQLTQEIFQTFTEQLNNVWYIVQRFVCQLCNKKFEYDIDFSEHMKRKNHLEKVGKLMKSKDAEICFDVCIPCASMSLGNSVTYTRHCEDTLHKYLVKSGDYSVPKMKKPVRNLLNDVEKIVDNLVLQSDAATLLEKKIDLLLECMEKTVKSQYPEAKAHVFGSRASNLAFNDSDVDIFLDCGGAYCGTQLSSKTREYLLKSQICFESQLDVWDVKEVLLEIRAPIIRVRHRELELNCDVSFTSGLTVEKTKIVKLFMTSFPPCRRMVLFLKKWLHTCLLDETQGLSTFGLTLLVIFYLQQISILPNIAELIKNKSQSKIVAGWETGAAKEIPTKSCSLTTRELLTGFFKFYANYDYRSCVISPLMGKSLEKQFFISSHNSRLPWYLPVEMESYSRCIKSMPDAEVFRIDSPMCLQDPIDLVQNITRSVSKLILRCFIQYCRSSAEILSNLP